MAFLHIILPPLHFSKVLLERLLFRKLWAPVGRCSKQAAKLQHFFQLTFGGGEMGGHREKAQTAAWPQVEQTELLRHSAPQMRMLSAWK